MAEDVVADAFAEARRRHNAFPCLHCAQLDTKGLGLLSALQVRYHSLRTCRTLARRCGTCGCSPGCRLRTSSRCSARPGPACTQRSRVADLPRGADALVGPRGPRAGPSGLPRRLSAGQEGELQPALLPARPPARPPRHAACAFRHATSLPVRTTCASRPPLCREGRSFASGRLRSRRLSTVSAPARDGRGGGGAGR
jgi:hypothetical protein